MSVSRAFDVQQHLTTISRRPYLEVKWRLVWLRTEHPESSVETVMVQNTPERVVFKATIAIPQGGSATGWGECAQSGEFSDPLEKAETKAIGRALAHLGYGTQFALEMDENVQPGTAAPQPAVETRSTRTAAQQREPRHVRDVAALAENQRASRPRQPDSTVYANGVTLGQLRRYDAITKELNIDAYEAIRMSLSESKDPKELTPGEYDRVMEAIQSGRFSHDEDGSLLFDGFPF